jgi:hypothetical protein
VSPFVGLISVIASTALTQATGTVGITVIARTPNAVHVEQEYVLAVSQPLELRALTRPCVVIDHVRIERDGTPLRLDETRDGRWITWRDGTASGGDSIRLVVRYDAWLGGSGAVPLVHLAAPVTRAGSRQGNVNVVVRFPRDGDKVVFPRMTRQAPNEWSGRFVAVPSFVKVRDPNPGCDALSRAPGDNGGLVWRFTLLVGIMVAWVPLYLAWARRTGDRA